MAPVHLPCHCRSRALHSLEEPNVPAENLGVINGEGADDPVDDGLEHGIQQSVAEVEHERPGVAVVAVLEIDGVDQLHSSVLELVRQTASPDGRSDDGDGDDSEQPSLPPAGESEVEEVADAGGADHLRTPEDDVVEPLGAEREDAAVELVGVEEERSGRRASPGGQEHEQHLPVGEELEDLGALGGGRGREGDDDDPTSGSSGLGAVVADDLGRRQHEHGEPGADEHEGYEGDVRAVVDDTGRLLVAAVVVEGEREETAEDAAEVEDAPEEGDVGAPAVRRRVRGHHGALRRPEETRAGAEQRARRDGERLRLRVVLVVEEGAGVEWVGERAQHQRRARAKEVLRAAAEDGEDGEAGVERRVGLVGRGGVDLVAAAQAGQRVEHAGAAEADEPQQGHLRQRRVVP